MCACWIRQNKNLDNKLTRSCQETFPPLLRFSPPTSCSPSLFSHSLTYFVFLDQSLVEIFQSFCCDEAGSTGSAAIISLALVLRCEVSSYICHCLAVAWDVENNTVQVWRQTVVTKRGRNNKKHCWVSSLFIFDSPVPALWLISWLCLRERTVHLSDSRRLPEEV